MSEQISKERLREQYQRPPILRGTGRQGNLLSKDWVARGAVQGIGATIFALVFILGSIALFIGSLLVRAETSDVMGDVLGPIARTMLAVFGFSIGCVAMFLGVRLLRGVARSFHKSNPPSQ
jgi:hypothetical protein